MAEWGFQTLLWYEMAYKDLVIPQAIVSSFDSSHENRPMTASIRRFTSA